MSNKLTPHSPFFPESAGEYLELNGWEPGAGSEFVGQYYIKGDEMITLQVNFIQFLTHQDEANGQKAGYSIRHSFSGIGDLSEFNWMLLFHITGAVPLRQFVKVARKESQIHPLFEEILHRHFRIGQSHDSIPENY